MIHSTQLIALKIRGQLLSGTPWAAHVSHAIEAGRKCKRKEKEDEIDLNESPRQKKTRDNACIAMKRGGRTMKLNAEKVAGDIEVGSIVRVPLADVDTTKVDGKNLTLVVVEKKEHGNGPARYRLACAKGPLKSLYSRVYITPVPQASRAVLGLETIYESWRGKAPITEREAAASTSLVGGQGKKKCGCKGSCDTNRCACRKAKRWCSSSCHAGLNHNCSNHPECEFI